MSERDRSEEREQAAAAFRKTLEDLALPVLKGANALLLRYLHRRDRRRAGRGHR